MSTLRVAGIMGSRVRLGDASGNGAGRQAVRSRERTDGVDELGATAGELVG